MSKGFKVGDIVRYVKPYDEGDIPNERLTVGDIGVVLATEYRYSIDDPVDTDEVRVAFYKLGGLVVYMFYEELTGVEET